MYPRIIKRTLKMCEVEYLIKDSELCEAPVSNFTRCVQNGSTARPVTTTVPGRHHGCVGRSFLNLKTISKKISGTNCRNRRPSKVF